MTRLIAVAVLAIALFAPSVKAQAVPDIDNAKTLNSYCVVYNKFSDNVAKLDNTGDAINSIACVQFLRGFARGINGVILDMGKNGLVQFTLSDSTNVQRISLAFTKWMRSHPEDGGKTAEVVLFRSMLEYNLLESQPAVLQAVNN